MATVPGYPGVELDEPYEVNAEAYPGVELDPDPVQFEPADKSTESPPAAALEPSHKSIKFMLPKRDTEGLDALGELASKVGSRLVTAGQEKSAKIPEFLLGDEPNAAQLVLAQTHALLNPFAGEGSPADKVVLDKAGKVAIDLAETLSPGTGPTARRIGDVAAATVQAAPALIGGIKAAAKNVLSLGAQAAKEGLKAIAPAVAKRAAVGATGGHAVNAAQSGLSAPEGGRIPAAAAALKSPELAVVGGIFGGLSAAKPHVFGRAAPRVIDAIAAELKDAAVPFDEAPTSVRPKLFQPDDAVAEFKPSMSSFAMDEDGRSPVAIVYELTTNGSPRKVTFPLDSPADGAKFSTYLREHNLPSPSIGGESGRAAIGLMGGDTYQAIYTGQSTRLGSGRKSVPADPDASPLNADTTLRHHVDLTVDTQGHIKATDGVELEPSADTVSGRAPRAPKTLLPETEEVLPAPLPPDQVQHGQYVYVGPPGLTDSVGHPDQLVGQVIKITGQTAHVEVGSGANARVLKLNLNEVDPVIYAPDKLVPPGVPHPGDTSMLSLPLASAVEANQLARGVKLLVNSRHKGALQLFKEAVAAPHLIAEHPFLRNFLSAARGAKQLDNPDLYLAAFRSDLPKGDLFRQSMKDLTPILEESDGALRERKLQGWFSKHPESIEAYRRIIEPTEKRLQSLSEALATELHAIPEEFAILRNAGEMKRYLMDFYRKNLLPGDKFKAAVDEADITKLMQFLQKQADVDGVKWVGPSLRAKAWDIMSSPTPEQALRSALGSASNSLKRKGEIPPEIAKIMGKETSGAARLAYAAARAESLVANLRLWKSLTEQKIAGADGVPVNPYWSRGPRDDLPVHIPDDVRRFGAAAGGYMRAELAPLAEMAKTPQTARNYLDFIGSVWKSNILTSVDALVNNALFNIVGHVTAGTFYPWQPVGFGKALVNAVGDLHQYDANPNGARAPIVREAISQGIFSNGYTGKYKRTQKLALEMLKDMTGQTDYWGIAKYIAGRTATLPGDAAAYVLDLTDRAGKLSAYKELRRQRITTLVQETGKAANDPDVVSAAAAWAGERVNEAFPNGGAAGKFVQSLTDKGFNAVNPFFATAADSLRALAFVPVIAKRNPAVLARYATYAAMVSGAISLNEWARRANGISDAEVEAADKIRGKQSKTYKRLEIVLPERDSKGRIQYANLTPVIQPAQMITGHTDNTFLQNGIANLLSMPVSGTGLEDAFRRNIELMGIARQTPNYTPQLLEGEAGTFKAMTRFLLSPGAAGIVPREVSRTYNTARKGEFLEQQLKPTEEPLTGGQVAANLLGAKINPVAVPRPGVNSPTQIQAMKEVQFRLHELQAQIKVIAKRLALKQISEQEAMALFSANQKAQLQLAAQLQEADNALKKVQGVK